MFWLKCDHNHEGQYWLQKILVEQFFFYYVSDIYSR